MLKLNDAKKILNNLQKAGGKLANGVTFKNATSKILPVVEASMVLNQVREIPVLKEIMTGFDKITEFVMDKMIANIPVIGWFAKPFHDNIMKPVGKITGGYHATEAENAREWYTKVKDVSMPKTEDRPIGMGFVGDVALADVNGAVPRMQHMNVNIFRLDRMECFRTQMTNLWENIIHGVKRSYTYTLEEVELYILNSISYYILGKYFEKKLGFMKFESVDFPDFKEQWALTYAQAGSSGLHDASTNAMFNVKDRDRGLTFTKEYYSYITELERSFLLPKNLKAWIDHYFGSVFLIDDDVHNWKIMDVNPVVLYFYYYDTTDHEIKANPIQLISVTIDDYYEQLVKFFKLNATIRADLDNAVVFSTSYDSKTPLLDVMDTGWFTTYDSYKPVITKSNTFVQALINAYTSDTDFGLAFKNNMIRFDYLDEEAAGDDLTTIIFAGAAVPSNNPMLKDGHLSVNNIAIVLNGTPELPVSVPYTWVYPGQPGGNTIYTQVTTPKVAIVRTTAVEYDKSRIEINGGTSVTTEISEVLVNTDTTNYSSLAVKSGAIYPQFSAGRYNMGTLAFKFHDASGHLVSNALLPLIFKEMHDNSQVHILIHLFDTATTQYYQECEVTEVSTEHYIVRTGVEQNLAYINKSDIDFNGMPFLFYSDEFTTTQRFVVNPLHGVVYDSYNSDLQLEYSMKDVYDFVHHDTEWTTNISGACPFEIDLYFTTDSNWNQLLVTYDCVVHEDSEIRYICGASPTTTFRTSADLPEKAYFADSLTRLYLYDQPATTPVAISFNTDAKNANYNEWIHMALGYSIPMILEKYSQVSVYLNNVWQGETLNRSFVLLKEDFVPFFINRADLPWVLYYMYSSLLFMELLPYKKK